MRPDMMISLAWNLSLVSRNAICPENQQVCAVRAYEEVERHACSLIDFVTRKAA
jgi:hypothetical protein